MENYKLKGFNNFLLIKVVWLSYAYYTNKAVRFKIKKMFFLPSYLPFVVS